MPRQHIKPVEAIAASPAMIAAMLCIRPDDLARAIAEKKIKMYQIGVRRRILVEDAKKWVRTEWREAQKRNFKPRKPKTNIGVSHAGTDATEHR